MLWLLELSEARMRSLTVRLVPWLRTSGLVDGVDVGVEVLVPFDRMRLLDFVDGLGGCVL